MVPPLTAQRLRFGVPAWTGQPLEGRTLLVLGEQGYGDVIQFLRYLPLVKSRGALIVFLTYKPMPELLDARSGVDMAIGPDDPLPPFDYCAHLLSLAHLFGTDVESIPQNVPYVRAREDRIARWRDRIAGDAALNVGLVWAGDPLGGRGRQKSLSLAQLAPWARVPGVRFHSLQKGDASHEAARMPADFPLTDLSPEIRDFADTAAIIASLDLVISVCTSVAHLAGAMGKPVWTMLPEPADWRWMEGRDDTPWYPTMRLFRQPAQGDWAAVVARGRRSARSPRSRASGRRAGRERLSHNESHARTPSVRTDPFPTERPSTVRRACRGGPLCRGRGPTRHFPVSTRRHVIGARARALRRGPRSAARSRARTHPTGRNGAGSGRRRWRACSAARRGGRIDRPSAGVRAARRSATPAAAQSDRERSVGCDDAANVAAGERPSRRIASRPRPAVPTTRPTRRSTDWACASSTG